MFLRKSVGGFSYSCKALGVLLISCFVLNGCDLAKNYTRIDRSGDSEVQDFRDGLTERLPEVQEESAVYEDAKIPALNPYIANTSQSLKSMPLVSVAVNQSVPLRDILYELAQQAEYDLELDPNIRGSIIFTARNKPFDVVVERIAGIANLRYKFEDEFLRVEVDSPYLKTYKIDYLNFVRTNSSGVSTNISVVSGDGADTGSNFATDSASDSDFWAELEGNLAQIIGGASTGALKTRNDPRITAVEQNPEVAALAPEDGQGGVNVQPPEAVLRVESLPVDGGGAVEDVPQTDSTYSINKQAGLVNIMASERVHKKVDKYLMSLKEAVTSQVLIEAKIFEVSLADEFITGIEWGALSNSGEGFAGLLNTRSVPVTLALDGAGLAFPRGEVNTNSVFSASWIGSDAAGFVEAISAFGTVRALASPRLTVLNNQSAVLNVVTNRVFFEIDLEEQEEEDGAVTTTTLEIDSEINSVPEGVLINVQPSVNLDDKTISMFVRPTITSIVGTVTDPAVALVNPSIVSEIPEVNVQEIDTVIKVNSGQAVVMGGLLQDRSQSTQEAVPVLGELPIIGSAFRSQTDLSTKTELVIFLKATLLESPRDTIHNTDRDLYRAFSGDRRPLKL